MSTSQHNTFQKLFVDYKPAVLKQTASDDWRIVFYVKIPGKEKMKRFRRRVPLLQNKTERHKYALKMIAGINRELERGWSPFYDGSAKNNTKTLANVLDIFLSQSERKLTTEALRKDTFRAYKSFCKNIKRYLKDQNKEQLLCIEFDRSFIINYIDYVFYEKKRTARTANNHLAFIKQLCIFMIDRKYLAANPAAKIDKRREAKKKRKVLPDFLRDKIFEHLKENNMSYFTACLVVYFCFIRRTEITKLKIKHLNLANNTIFIPAEISKNRIDGVVTVNTYLKSFLEKHILNCNSEDFVFSEIDFNPGTIQLRPRKISEEWAKMRKVLDFGNQYQFYSLKDTGITNLLMRGVPAKKVRDQARHHDIRITEKYTPESTEADRTLLNLDF